MLVNASIVEGRMVVPPYSHFRKEDASLEDLLTGRTVEQREFDLNIPEQAEAAKDFEDWAVRVYGPHPEGYVIQNPKEIPKAPTD